MFLLLTDLKSNVNSIFQYFGYRKVDVDSKLGYLLISCKHSCRFSFAILPKIYCNVSLFFFTMCSYGEKLKDKAGLLVLLLYVLSAAHGFYMQSSMC